jgi:ubiquitin-conjugating enzyme E2 Z
MRNVKALVIGPPDTPYEYGFFEFSVKFSDDYPSKPPLVNATTTNKGHCRFNPNIYAQGKVCLSILGTWAGETSGEEWSSAQGLESVLISIQSRKSPASS